MLSQHDRRALSDIEQHLRAEAPDLVQLLEGFDRWAPAPRHRRIRQLAAPVVIAVGSVLLAVAFAVHSAACLLLAAVVLLPVLAWAVFWSALWLAGHHRRGSPGR